MKKIIIALLLILSISTAIYFNMYQKDEETDDSKPVAAGNFEKCAETGGVVMESYPMQCRDKLGNLYVQEIIDAPVQKDDYPKAVKKAISTAAEDMQVDESKISVINYEEMDWPDGCLGISEPDVMCTMAIVPGYRVIVSIDGVEYTYRTNDDGSVVKAEF